MTGPSADNDRKPPLPAHHTASLFIALQIQLDALERAQYKRIFSENISSRIKVRPEFDKALALAHDIKQAAPDQPVILTIHELKRPARNALS